MADIRSVAVARDVGGPFELRRVGVARADVFVLECFQLLGCAEFVGLGAVLVGAEMGEG